MAYYEEMTDELAERVGALMVNTGAKSMERAATAVAPLYGLRGEPGDTELTIFAKQESLDKLIADIHEGVKSGRIVPHGSEPETYTVDDNAERADAFLDTDGEDDEEVDLSDAYFDQQSAKAAESFTDYSGKDNPDDADEDAKLISKPINESFKKWLR